MGWIREDRDYATIISQKIYIDGYLYHQHVGILSQITILINMIITFEWTASYFWDIDWFMRNMYIETRVSLFADRTHIWIFWSIIFAILVWDYFPVRRMAGLVDLGLLTSKLLFDQNSLFWSLNCFEFRTVLLNSRAPSGRKKWFESQKLEIKCLAVWLCPS